MKTTAEFSVILVCNKIARYWEKLKDILTEFSPSEDSLQPYLIRFSLMEDLGSEWEEVNRRGVRNRVTYSFFRTGSVMMEEERNIRGESEPTSSPYC